MSETGMGGRSLFGRAIARLNAAVNPVLNAYTHPASTSEKSGREIFSKRERSLAELESWETRYLQGGPVREAIDAYALYALSNGWYVDGSDEALVKDVEARLDELDIEGSLWQGIVDALVFGDAFQELATGMGDMDGEIVAILPRPAKMFDIVTDSAGVPAGYVQYYGERQDQKIQLSLNRILHVSLFHVGGAKYGMSLINSAKDDIDRDARMIDSLTDAIERHGHPRYHARVGREGEDPGPQALDAVADQLHELNSKTELATCRDVEIVSLDAAGVGNTKLYSDLTLGRMACALGVPLDVLGVTEGSNRSTATVRQDVFENKIGMVHRRLERIYNAQLIDRLSGVPGAVKLKFNDVSPEDELKEAEYVAKVLQADPISPIAGPRWARKRLKINEEEAF